MKKLVFIIFSFYYLVIIFGQTSVFAVGQNCCDSVTYYSYDSATGKCKNAYAGVPSVPTSCNADSEICNGTTCVAGTQQNCDSHQSCSNASYRSSHIGCTWTGVYYYCAPLGNLNPSSTTPTPAPTLPPIESTGQTCSSLGKNTIYPPNSSCYAEVKTVESNISQYPLTCIPAPEVSYAATVSGITPPSSVTVSLTSDLSKVTLGFLGPDSKSLSSVDPDQIAKKYLFNGLFDRPYFSNSNTSRELFRTYWRVLNSQVQANLKAIYLEAANTQNSKLSYYYLDDNSQKQETDTQVLYSELPNCLRKYPVCKNYVTQYKFLPKSVKTRYDTLLPFDFNDNRSYIALLGNVSKESIPYLTAILEAIQGDNSLINLYAPNWLKMSTASLSTISVSSENSLYQSISNIDLLSSCVIPQRTTSAAAPYTYPDGPSLSQNVTIPLTSKLVSTTDDSCKDAGSSSPECRYASCDYYDNNPTQCRALEQKGCCTFIPGINTYQLTGRATGRHATVFNNPLINSLNELVTDFYHLLVPTYAQQVEKTIVSAPASNVTASDPNATVSNNGSSPVYRENALAQNSMHLLQNCWLVASDQQSSAKCGSATKTPPGECKISDEPLSGSCSKASFTSFFNGGTPYISYIPNVTPELSAVYAEAEKQTGTSCVILAAIHFMEGGNNPCQSLISGRKIGEPEPDNGGAVYNTLLETAIAAGNEFQGKLAAAARILPAGSNDFQKLVAAFSYYNGGGNSNCRSDPPSSNYGGCPPLFPGEDDPYATSWLDQKHANMFLRCPRDGYCGASIPFNRPGAYTVALSYYLSLP